VGFLVHPQDESFFQRKILLIRAIRAIRGLNCFFQVKPAFPASACQSATIIECNNPYESKKETGEYSPISLRLFGFKPVSGFKTPLPYFLIRPKRTGEGGVTV
jgi:hypothetical protein